VWTAEGFDREAAERADSENAVVDGQARTQTRVSERRFVDGGAEGGDEGEELILPGRMDEEGQGHGDEEARGLQQQQSVAHVVGDVDVA